MSNVHHSLCSYFGLVLTQESYLSLGIALIFQINLGIHSKNLCPNLIYYYLYHEEASFHLEYRHPDEMMLLRDINGNILNLGTGFF